MKLNNIYLGDSFNLIKQIKNNSIDLIYTDIPYFYNSGGGGKSNLSKRIIKINNELNEISNGINYDLFFEFKRVMKKVNIFIWCSKLQIIDIMNFWTKDKNINYEILVWTKTNPTPATNNVWLPDIEYCLYFREKGVKLSNGYDLKSKWFNSAINKSDKDLYNHPTIKPLELVKRHIKHTTAANQVVLDPFLGSGTTAIAAKELNLKYIGFEINKEYFKIANDRLNNLTQLEVKEISKGIQNIFDFL